MWRVGGGRGDALAGILEQSLWVSGVRVAGALPAGFDYTTEWITQTGNLQNSGGRESINAFAQHTVLRKGFETVVWKPRLIGEHNFASGDSTPGDGRSGTFDQMFPTPHEKYGLADQVGWQNVQHVAGGVEAKPVKHLVLRAMIQDWYLAQAKDGLYAAGGGLVFRDATGKSGKHVGEEVDLIAQYNWGPRYVGGGYGHLFAGEFLHAQSPGAGLNYVYVNVGYRF
jgi:Alginate export